MSRQPEPIFTANERDILQEVMNIGFGKASADLAEVIDIYVVLSVPEVALLDASELAGYIGGEIRDFERISVVEQSFMGRFQGVALLIFPSEAGRKLISILGQEDEQTALHSVALLERETLMEVGNILIGACVGKLAELLDDQIAYSPPRVLVEDDPRETVTRDMFNPDSTAIVMRTLFSFENENISGYLFLITRNESIAWMVSALHSFMERYE